MVSLYQMAPVQGTIDDGKNSEYDMQSGHVDQRGDDNSWLESDTDSDDDTLVSADDYRISSRDVDLSGEAGVRSPVEDVVRPAVQPPVRPSSVLQVKRGAKGRFERYSEGSTSSPGTSKKKKQKTDSWQLSGPAPGGPAIPDVIPSFGGHVAFGLFTDPGSDRGVLRAHKGARIPEELRSWWQLSEEARALVGESGVDHLAESMLSQLDFALLSAFIERWQPDTNTFHMPFGEMTIMLHDVAYILGVPVDGRSCSVGEDGGDHFQMLADVLGVHKAELTLPWQGRKLGICKGTAALYAALRHHAGGGGRSATVQAQGYLLTLLGSTLFVDKSGDRVQDHCCLCFRILLRFIPMHGVQELLHTCIGSWGSLVGRIVARLLVA